MLEITPTIVASVLVWVVMGRSLVALATFLKFLDPVQDLLRVCRMLSCCQPMSSSVRCLSGAGLSLNEGSHEAGDFLS